MPSDPVGLSKHAIEAKLKVLRDDPVTTASVQDKDMQLLHSHLMSASPDLDGSLHWFCPRAEPLTRELATFLLRLHGYKDMDAWRSRIKDVWKSCADCIRYMDEAKVGSRKT